MTSYVPDIGDVVWLQFSPQAGREQMGHRPALVLSPLKYNEKTHLMLCCPMTTKIKGYPFEVLITEKDGEKSAVLSDQVKSLDWVQRRAKFKHKINHRELQEVLQKIKALLCI